MKKYYVSKSKWNWKIFHRTKRTQAALMCIQPGSSEGSSTNKHPNSDQWVYVVSGTGRAKIGRKSVLLTKGILILIEAGEAHEIISTKSKLVTLNFYGPPVNFSELDE